MGLTIHYSGGKAKSRKDIDECLTGFESLVCALKDTQKQLQVDYWFEDKYSRTWEEKQPKQYRGICINIDEGCETSEFGFDLDTFEFYGGFCKTQFSKHFVEAHHYVCWMLDLLKKTYVADLEVYDEGEYFGNWDKEKLGIEVQEWHKLVIGMVDQIKKSGFETDQIGGAALDWLKS